MRHVKVHYVRIPRPCGCSSPIVGIFTDNPQDRISIASHTHSVNQNCEGRVKGITHIRRWLSVRDWVKKYTHTRNRAEYRSFLQVQCIELKEQNPRIPEEWLI